MTRIKIKEILDRYEVALEKIVAKVKSLAFFELLEYLGRLTVLIGIITFITGVPQRNQQAQNEKDALIFEAWKIIKTAENDRSGVVALAVKRLFEQEFPLKGLSIKGTNLEAIELPGVNLSESNLSGSALNNSILSDADLRTSTLDRAVIVNADLARADFFGASLKGVDFSGSNLEGVDFKAANLTDATFTGVNLRDSNLSESKLGNATFQGADLTGSNFSDSKEVNLDHLENASVICNTLFPDGSRNNRDCP